MDEAGPKIRKLDEQKRARPARRHQCQQGIARPPQRPRGSGPL